MFIESTTRVDGMGDGQDISPRGYPEGQSVGASAGPRVGGSESECQVMSCRVYQEHHERTDGRTDGQTDGRTDGRSIVDKRYQRWCMSCRGPQGLRFGGSGGWSGQLLIQALSGAWCVECARALWARLMCTTCHGAVPESSVQHWPSRRFMLRFMPLLLACFWHAGGC